MPSDQPSPNRPGGSSLKEHWRNLRAWLSSSNAEGKEPRPTVILVPPYYVPHVFMWIAAARLYAGGYRPRVFRYNSRTRGIPENAELLARFIVETRAAQIDVVAVSMGCILTRWAANQHQLPPIRRVVMLGPPNRGAILANGIHRRLGRLTRLLGGDCALQLRFGEDGLCERAGAFGADTELGIIAGGLGNERGISKRLPGDNDGIVAVEETIMPSMRDFALVRSRHMILMHHPRGLRYMMRFLKNGRFRDRQKGH